LSRGRAKGIACGVTTPRPLLASALVLATALAGARASAEPPAAPPANAPAASPTPPPIDVKDPLLAPVAPAPHVLGGFRDALDLVASRSIELAVALKEIERAEGLTRQALGAALTTVTATGTVKADLIRKDVTSVDYAASAQSGAVVNTTTTVPPTPTALASLTATQPIFAPRAWHAIGTARRSVEVARLSSENVRRTILTAVANAIVGVVTAERVAEINRVGLKTALERLELTQRRARLGSGTRLDVVRAEQDVTSARAQIVTGDESLRLAREALGLSLGSTDAYGVLPTISIDGIEQALHDACKPGTPETRPDVLSARAQVEVAERTVKEARLGFSPTAAVSSTFSYSSEQMQNTLHYAWSVQGVLTVPIWDGGSRYGEIRAAKATSESQRARLEGTRRQATLDAIQAQRSVDVADQARAQSTATRDLARESSRLTQAAYESGAATSFELVDAGRQLRQAELDLVLKEFSVVKARMAALLATATCTM
jgi:outer membrane protein TolC